MNHWGRTAVTGLLLAGLVSSSQAQSRPEPEESVEQLQEKVRDLNRQLEEAKKALAESQKEDQQAEQEASQAETMQQELDRIEASPKIGPITFGGAIRANYIYGDYVDTGGPSRGSDGGNFELDTFRINADLLYGNIVGKAEYRWYNGYNFFHTAWLGYNFEDDSQVQVGLNRVPFGAGPYGVSQSWFFDQSYYVGLADDMDLGIKYLFNLGDTELALAYYYSAQPNGLGYTDHAARYDSDMVRNDEGVGYEERNQVNARIIQPIEWDEGITTDLGASFQIGQLINKGDADEGEDGTAYATAVHAVNQIHNWKLALQLTYYNYDIDGSDLINRGFYDFYADIATEGWIPAVSLSYYKETPDILWLDYVIPYIEYSSIMKNGETADGASFKDSDLFTIGAAWAHNGWYIYTEYAYSNGNSFVGGDPYNNFGANLDATWEGRFNINFGYYF
ncbi:hypothetical protein H5P30_09510 [Puniceicoccus vermicola]|uniref:Carbohydrate porin n=2 Tax=Puniceicoccus vermicola TaxID=388746 RepID=A0A7X1E4I0_9BACT|nr:hypothetical protein [Puniceicoccus vermicola]